MYVFGGWDPGRKGSGGAFLDDVWRLDTDALEWRQVAALPAPVSRHSSCSFDDKVVLHTFRDTLVFEGGEVRVQPTTGDAPAGLSMCAAARVGDSMLVIGGSTRERGMSNDVYRLNTTTWEWAKMRRVGHIPSPRASACATSLGASRCVVFGGAGLGAEGYADGMGLQPSDETYLVEVRDDDATLTRLEHALAPTPRVAASLDTVDGRLVLQGGWNPTSMETFEETFGLVP